jgi:hypothetical protein
MLTAPFNTRLAPHPPTSAATSREAPGSAGKPHYRLVGFGVEHRKAIVFAVNFKHGCGSIR